MTEVREAAAMPPQSRDMRPETHLWFDVSQAIIHFGRYGKPTGIERVTCCLLRAIRDSLPPAQTHLYRIDAATGVFHEVSWDFLDLIAASGQNDRAREAPQPYSAGRATNARPSAFSRRVYELLPYELQPSARQLAMAAGLFARGLVRAIHARALALYRSMTGNAKAAASSYARKIVDLTGPPTSPGAGSVLVNLGATWGLSRHAEAIKDLKRRLHVKYVVMIYDIISLNEPDFFPSYFFDVFRHWFVQTLALADHVLAISRYTKQDILSWCGKNAVTAPPITALPLAQDLPVGAGGGASGETEPRMALPAALDGKPFVLFVSTLDPRKNHVLLFEVWKRLVAKHGQATPRLVFVGNRGWGVEDLINRLDSARWLDGDIVWFATAGDVLLRGLYRACLFTIYPSLSEGWGLPVGESLAFGRPCIASNSSSIPEVGGDFVDYFDPTDLRECYALVEKYSFDAAYRESRETLIREQFRPRLWSDAAREALDVMADLSSGQTSA